MLNGNGRTKGGGGKHYLDLGSNRLPHYYLFIIICLRNARCHWARARSSSALSLKKKTTTLILIYSIMWEVWVGTGAAATAMVCASSESWFAAATFAAVAATLALRSSYKGM